MAKPNLTLTEWVVSASLAFSLLIAVAALLEPCACHQSPQPAAVVPPSSTVVIEQPAESWVRKNARPIPPPPGEHSIVTKRIP